MNATSLDELRGSTKGRDIVDEKMEQVRELLVGEDLRRSEARLLAMEHRIGELEAALGQRLDALSARLDAIAGELTADRRASLDDLARCVTSLGDEIRRISKS